MSQIVTFEQQDKIGVIKMDDGKANAMSFEMAAQMNAALDEAEKNSDAIVLEGGAKCFCAGFDLETMKAGGPDRDRLLKTGFALSYRLLNAGRPVIAKSAGHALAMGAILLLSCDYRIGVNGSAKIGLNEIAIGVEMPGYGVDLVLDRLAKPAQIPALANSVIYTPDQAVQVGFLDEAVEADALNSRVNDVAGYLASLNMPAHQKAKRALRADFLAKYEEMYGA
ncbi:MAG: crotonase/enoyl-CoA hydratase family protein [Terasakiella sp.]|uniref:crotonase/enoyl-CoA hydratase family protein n=1 Tax=unclassified Terasakiella TaxID=2614952 RepID=UPI003B000CB7